MARTSGIKRLHNISLQTIFYLSFEIKGVLGWGTGIVFTFGRREILNFGGKNFHTNLLL